MKKSGFTNGAKGFQNRRKGVMKKANMLSKLTGAHMAVLCEYNGDIFIYQSDDRFSPVLNGVTARQHFGPDHFDTVADRATSVSRHRLWKSHISTGWHHQIQGNHRPIPLMLQINYMIFDWLDWINPDLVRRSVQICQHKKARSCCKGCRHFIYKPRQWSPWTLTQLSKAHHDHWRPYYYDRISHFVCVAQLGNYLDTFFGKNGQRECHGRRGPPTSVLYVRVTEETIIRTPLHLMLEARNLFQHFQWSFPNGWGWSVQEKVKLTRWTRLLQNLTSFRYNCLMKQLLPGERGSEKIKELFLDEDTNLWLHPAPDYFSSFPALDPALRTTLHNLWRRMPLSCIYLQLVSWDDCKPTPRKAHHCQKRYRFWQIPPQNSLIRSVRHSDFNGDFIVRPYAYVLPQGYSLTSLGVNEQELRKETGAAVYVQLVNPKDKKFNIRIKQTQLFSNANPVPSESYGLRGRYFCGLRFSSPFGIKLITNIYQTVWQWSWLIDTHRSDR